MPGHLTTQQGARASSVAVGDGQGGTAADIDEPLPQVSPSIDVLFRPIPHALPRHHPYRLSRPSIPMKRLLALALTVATLLMGTSATACEKHLNGHQNGSDTNLEGSKK